MSISGDLVEWLRWVAQTLFVDVWAKTWQPVKFNRETNNCDREGDPCPLERGLHRPIGTLGPGQRLRPNDDGTWVVIKLDLSTGIERFFNRPGILLIERI